MHKARAEQPGNENDRPRRAATNPGFIGFGQGIEGLKRIPLSFFLKGLFVVMAFQERESAYGHLKKAINGP